MKEDYLWDKTAEPDPEIQQLEEVLGTLRYQPKPLAIPAGLQVGRPRNFLRDFGPRLAIAATIAMLLIGLGLWFGLQRRQPAEVVRAPTTGTSSPTPVALPAPSDNQSPNVAGSLPTPKQERIEAPHRHRVNPSVLARDSSRPRNEAAPDPQIAVRQREGEAAKDQLMLALRVASTKLSFAQKKMQGTNSKDLIHNQHKTG